MSTISIKKHQVEVYKIRSKSGHIGWADITIDANGGTGRISIASDYGSWQHYWGAAGTNFKAFLSKIDMYYAASKFGADKHFDLDGSIKEMKEAIIHHRKIMDIDKDEARDLFNDVKEIADEYPSKEQYMILLSVKYDLLRFFDHCPPVNTTVSPGFLQFWNKVWGPFLANLEAEKTVTA